jgi:NAD(P)-dependent dehydrogenase (short-subunit alcohol dehydrogenase family)
MGSKNLKMNQGLSIPNHGAPPMEHRLSSDADAAVFHMTHGYWAALRKWRLGSNMPGMKHHLYILTGASRGMGLAMAEQLLQTGNALLCISRNANPALDIAAQKAAVPLTQWTHDLADGDQASARLLAWLQAQNPADFASACLLNNAGVIPPIVPLRQARCGVGAVGQVVEEIKDVKPGMELQLGVKYTSGTYTAVFIQGSQVTRQRMVRY